MTDFLKPKSRTYKLGFFRELNVWIGDVFLAIKQNTMNELARKIIYSSVWKKMFCQLCFTNFYPFFDLFVFVDDARAWWIA